MQFYPMPHPHSHQSGRYFKRPVFDRFSRSVHDRLGQRQSGQQQHAAPGRPVQPDRSQQRAAQSHPPKQEYRFKKKEDEAQPMQVDSGKTTTNDVVQISDVNMVVKDVEKRPMVFDKSVDPRNQKLVMADNHEASSSSTDQYS